MDKKRNKKIVPTIITIAVVLISLAYISVFVALAFVDAIVWPICLVAIVIYLIVCGGIIAALRERIKEINGGEEDEALKY